MKRGQRKGPKHGRRIGPKRFPPMSQAEKDERQRREEEADAACLPPELRNMLEIAVPMWMERLRGMPAEERARRKDAALDVIAHKSDVLDRAAKKGAVAEAFNAIAEGLAHLALNHADGVRWCGLQFKREQEVARAP